MSTIGDAASVLDPISSHGILKAMMSGIMASYLIIQGLGKNVSAEQTSDFYNRWITNWFLTDAKRLCQMYQELDYAPNWLPETARKLTNFNSLKIKRNF